MADELPLYSDSMLRTRLQFADLDRLKGKDDAALWEKADGFIAAMDGAVNIRAARDELRELSKERFLRAHFLLFEGREGAGLLRTTELRPKYRGQDCAPPEFIEGSLDRLFQWFSAESFDQIHPIEKATLAMTRIVDVWPFELGNLTAALLLANLFLKRDGLAPFFVRPEHAAEFESILGRAMSIDMQPLINAVYNTVKGEMTALGK